MSSLPKEDFGVAEQIFEKPKRTTEENQHFGNSSDSLYKIREHFYKPRKYLVSDVLFWPKRQELHPFLGFSLNDICGEKSNGNQKYQT